MAKTVDIKFGIIVALQQELSTLGNIRLNQGSCASLSENVLVYVSGMGAAHAREAGEDLLKKGADVLISWGTAAALMNDLSAGALIIPDNIVTAEGQIIDINHSLTKIIRKKIASKVPLSSATLCESKNILSTPKDKEVLAKQAKAKIADMESGAIAKLAREQNIPFVAIRAVSDSVDTFIPEVILKAMNDGSMDTAQLLYRLTFAPRAWGSVIHLAKEFNKAKKTLVNASSVLLPLFNQPIETDSSNLTGIK